MSSDEACRPPLGESWREREDLAERIAERLDRPLTIAGFAFLGLVVLDALVAPGSVPARVSEIFGWALWALFVFEFVLRLVIAPSTRGFLRRNWWQLIFLAVPFLRFLRPVARLRIPRLGRVLSSAVRTTRTATRRLSGRLGWLSAVTAIVILSASQIAYEFGRYDSYWQALHASALATVTGEPLAQDSGVAQVLEVVLAVYSVVVFATLAGVLGAYFLEHRDDVLSVPAADDPSGKHGKTTSPRHHRAGARRTGAG